VRYWDALLGYRTGLLTVAAVVSLGSAGARAAGPAPTSAAELRALLVGAQVPLARGATAPASSFPAAWTAFQQFARDGGPNTVLRFEFGVFESHFWGTSFEVQLQSRQVHLVVHFPVAAYLAITRNLRATPCVPGSGCVFRCFFTGDDGLVPHACRVAADGYRVGDMTLTGRQITAWIAGVASSPVVRALLARHVRPVGFEVWTE
jgi:hypothetical protein